MRGVIFDLDGTLLDSMQMWTGIDRKFLRENGIEPPPDISDIVKQMSIAQSSAYFVERFHLRMTADAVAARIEALADAEYRYNLPLKDGAFDLLTALHQRGIPCCIASVTYSSLIEAVCERLSIRSLIQFYFTPNAHLQGKHTPDLYFAACERLGFAPKETVVVEDALYAAKTAHQAGFYTVGVLDTVGAADWDALRHVCDCTVSSLHALCTPNFLNLFL